jgi:DNA-binding NarL/FixJ family response regulator
MSRISIVLAEDHTLVREGVRFLLKREKDFVVVGETADGLEVVPLVERLKPDVLLMDLILPGLNGLELTRRVVRKSAGTRVVVLSMHDSEVYVMEAFKNGAAGYLMKGCTAAELAQAVRSAASGRKYISRQLSDRVAQACLEPPDRTAQGLFGSLTAREREILYLVAEGYTSAEIADRLFISRRTVETHRANLMTKLGLSNQSELIRYALRSGLLPL